MTDDARADVLAQAFARNVLAACARTCGIAPEMILAASSAAGSPRGDLGATRTMLRELAEAMFPDAHDAPRKLRRLIRGQCGPSPLWSDLAALERGLGV